MFTLSLFLASIVLLLADASGVTVPKVRLLPLALACFAGAVLMQMLMF